MGLEDVDRLDSCDPCTLNDYLRAASIYVRQSHTLAPGPKKAAQIRLSSGLGMALAHELKTRLPQLHPVAGETKVAGALRTAQADVCEFHRLDGLRLAVEIKPVNLAVGRALWNRFGDIRAFAVNIHLKFPFAVVGGVLSVPTYEERAGGAPETRAATRHLVQRMITRLLRPGLRRSEADAAHLLEAIAVLLYDPDSASLDTEIPSPATGLRWDEFIDNMVKAYEARFE